MRLWSLSPELLDSKGLVALWREACLAQAVLIDPSKGYSNHSQLVRFKASIDPIGAIGFYLYEIALEATRRGYKFDYNKIASVTFAWRGTFPVTQGQVEYERIHLNNKLLVRDPALLESTGSKTIVHPLFYVVDGPIESWEKLI